MLKNYTLFGCILHKGTKDSSGHYYSIIKYEDDWYVFKQYLTSMGQLAVLVYYIQTIIEDILTAPYNNNLMLGKDWTYNIIITNSRLQEFNRVIKG